MGASAGNEERLGRFILGGLLGLTVLLGCTGRIGDVGEGAGLDGNGPGGPGGPAGPGGPGGPGGLGGGTGVGGDGNVVLPPARPPAVAGYEPGEEAGLSDRPAPLTRLARVTHEQWSNSLRDLLGIPATELTTVIADFRNDPSTQGFLFDTNAASLSVDDALWTSYQRASETLAARVVGDAALLGAILPPDGGDPLARAREFITTFGERMYRRPLSGTEADELVALYQGAPGLYPGVADFESGIRLVLEAMLQSPGFLYRVEASTTATGDVIPLTGYELATRLSFMLWNTTPDTELLRAARDGELVLASQMAAQAERLLADRQAEDVIARFHDQLLDVDHYASISPAPAFYPDAPPNLGDLARAETERFVRTIVGDGGGYGELLTSTRAFVNADLATLYGLSGSFGTDLTEATLDPAQRKGFLTQIGFLASNATAVNPDPIHRGVFVAKRILCTKIAAPPNNVPPLPPADGRTNRQTVTDHTEQAGTVCVSCHGTVINPLGFPFESYDSVGAFRTTDLGQPVDTTSQPTIGGVAVPVADAIDLVDALAASDAAHECYAKHWIEYAYGRPKAAADLSLTRRLGAASKARTLSVKDLVLGLVQTEAFLTRSTEELP